MIYQEREMTDLSWGGHVSEDIAVINEINKVNNIEVRSKVVGAGNNVRNVGNGVYM